MLYLAIFLQIVTMAMIALQWYLLARRMGEKVSYRDMVHLNLVGSFVESVTPAMKAGGEGAKVWLLCTRMQCSASRAIALLTIQKVISVIPFLLLSAASLGWLLANEKISGPQGTLFVGSFLFLFTVVFVLMALLLASQKIIPLLYKVPLSDRWEEKISNGVEQFRQASQNVKGPPITWIGHSILSILIWVLFAVKAYIVVLSMEVPISFLVIAVVTFLSYMVAMVPLTPGGLGTFEGAMMLLLSRFSYTFGSKFSFGFGHSLCHLLACLFTLAPFTWPMTIN
ncbi:flippase-like domain-containing protein [Heliorestis convoluta]|uniref:Phosphatidylglycerol lysyltransferase n=1 Tax=Heliorestis convoluta TaxID=356322 RepID=A0A5Q2MWF7_9FIRM|nr:flippase-like domain-containing protein [Heliorestis convoluta]